MRTSCEALKIWRLAPGTLASFGRRRCDDFIGCQLSLVEGLERKNMRAAVCAAREAQSVAHTGVGFHDVDHAQQSFVDRLEGGVLIGLDGALDAAVVLFGEEAFRDFDEQKYVERNGGEEDGERYRGEVKDCVQRAAVGVDNPLEEPFAGAVEIQP